MPSLVQIGAAIEAIKFLCHAASFSSPPHHRKVLLQLEKESPQEKDLSETSSNLSFFFNVYCIVS